MTFLFSYFFKCVNRSFFGISAMYFFLSFSKNAMESLEKPCPFQVEVLVIRIQHCPSGYFRMRADVPDREPVLIQGLPLAVKFQPIEKLWSGCSRVMNSTLFLLSTRHRHLPVLEHRSLHNSGVPFCHYCCIHIHFQTPDACNISPR